MSQVFISAAHKSSGKTLVSTGLCAAYRRRGMRVAAFKKGPDYIDPAWLTKASGNSCWNLDFFTMNQEEILTCFKAQRQGADVTVVEGNPWRVVRGTKWTIAWSDAKDASARCTTS